MIKEITVTKANGLKAEDCAVIAQTASTFLSDIFTVKNDAARSKINAKSIVGILSLNIKGGEVVYLSVSGTDEEFALNKLTSLF